MKKNTETLYRINASPDEVVKALFSKKDKPKARKKAIVKRAVKKNEQSK